MKQLSGKRPKRLFILKIDLPALLAFAFFAGLIFFYLIPGFEKVMMDRKREMIHEITSSAYSLLEYYHSLETRGTLVRDEAEEQARSAINTIRYGEERKDYLWITDMFPRMIVHPYRPDLNGKDLTDFRDSRGKRIFVEFVKAVSTTGESYVEYMWQWNDDSTRIVPKLSYVRKFEPWNWIVGTGIYIEDVRAEIRRIELRALIISGIIGIAIIILLAAISRQSHKIEQKRGNAEEELRKSRELYRTLAEAASEGVMIWSGQKLQVNKILLSWLGYTEEEFQDIPLKNVLISGDIEEFVDSDALYEELSTRRYIECVLRKKDDNHIKSFANFSRIQLGVTRAVLIVIRPAESVSALTGFSPQLPLFNSISTGFFRITYGRKNRFLYATRPVLQILGFNSLQELSPHTIDSFFVKPDQFKAFRSALASREDIFNNEVLLQRKGGDQFWALVSVTVVESNSEGIWCEGTIEPLAASSFNNNSLSIDLIEYSSSFIMQAPVSSISRPHIECSEKMTVIRAVSVMKENNTHVVVVTNKKGEPMGVIDSGTIGYRLTEGVPSDTEIFRLMSSPPLFIRHDASISEAFELIQTSLKKSLLVTSEQNKIAGIVTMDELSQAFSKAPNLIISEIGNASSVIALRTIFLNSRKTANSMILGHADPSAVTRYISTIADAFCQRALSLCIEEAGEPPCRFAFIQTGSAGRKEQTLTTDQDNAIIFENLKGEKLKEAGTYFLSLGKRVNEMLATVGYNICKGENMAGNPKWCQPLDKWKKYFSDWIKMPGPDEILEISIFFDFRFCSGDPGLSDELREYINKDLKTNDIFFHHMISAWKQFNPSANILSGSNTDIKRLLMPLTGIVRVYALKYGINGLSTFERIIDLYSANHLDHLLLFETLRAFKDLTSIRLNHQLNCINAGKDPDNVVDFNLINRDLLLFAEQAVTTINNLMLKAGSDFYTATI